MIQGGAKESEEEEPKIEEGGEQTLMEEGVGSSHHLPAPIESWKGRECPRRDWGLGQKEKFVIA